MTITSPADLSGLAWWLDADQETGYAHGAPVTTWSDRSGNGRHATRSAGLAPLMVENAQNGRRALLFDGTKELLAPSGFITTGSGTMFGAYAAVDTGGDPYLVSSTDIGGGFPAPNRYRWYFGPHRFALGQDAYLLDGGQGFNFEDDEVFGRWVSLHGVADGTNWGTGTRCSRNAKPRGPLSATPTTGTATNRPVGVGVYVDQSTQRFAGVAGEIIHYARALSEAEIDEVHQYLAVKWGIRCGGFVVGAVSMGRG